MSDASPDPGSWRRLAVLAPNWIGDAVMAEPAMAALHDAHPTLEITAFGRAAPLSAWSGHPAFRSIVIADDRGWRGPWTTGRRIAATRPDAVLLLRGSFRSALVARISAAPIRIGVDRDARRPLLTHPVPRPDRDGRPRPTLDLYDALVGAIGVEVRRRLPRLSPDAEATAAAASMLADLPRPIVGLVPGGSKTAKRWPPDRFAELVGRCGERIGTAVLFGSPDERDVLDAVVAATRPGPGIVDLTRRGLGLRTLPAAIAACDAIVTNDTGPRHLAIAQGVPTISLFGPTDHRWTIVPGARERLLLAEPFLDDEHIADEHPQACRIDRIPVGDVAEALSRILGEATLAERVSSSDA
jgi:heptosyltransferase-2